MRAEVVAVGTELLLGQIANTNAQWISEQLATMGVDVLRHQAVGDNHERVVEAIVLAASRSDVVIISGGLGPTQDDLTRPALAHAAGARLVRVPQIEQALRERFHMLGRPMSDSNLAQADVPEGGRFIAPERGTAPGLVVRIEGATVYALPGVPIEMREMMQGTVLPEVGALAGPFSGLRGKLRLPVRGELVGLFGAPREEGPAGKKGVFIRAREGQPVLAVAAGQVVYAEWMRGYGNLLIVDHGEAYLSIYANNESLLKQTGDPVAAGEIVATVGASGGNEQSGLYFELRHLGKAFDPLRWVVLK